MNVKIKNNTQEAIPLPGPAQITIHAGQEVTVNQNCIDLPRVQAMGGLVVQVLRDGQGIKPVVESASTIQDHADPEDAVDASEDDGPEEGPALPETGADITPGEAPPADVAPSIPTFAPVVPSTTPKKKGGRKKKEQ